MTLTLQEAIAEVPKPIDGIWRAFGDCGEKVSEPVATILNAVASGDLIPRPDAEQAVALAYQRAGDVADGFHQRALEWAKKVRGLKKHIGETDSSRIRDAILALAPADALAEVEALKVERDERNREMLSMERLSIERRDRAEAAEAEVARLREALQWYGEQARLCRLIHSEGDAGRQALNDDGGKRARAALGDAG